MTVREGIVARAWGGYAFTLHPQSRKQRELNAWAQLTFPFIHHIFLYKQKLSVKTAATESQNRCGVGSSHFLIQTESWLLLQGMKGGSININLLLLITMHDCAAVQLVPYGICGAGQKLVCLRWFGLSSLMEIYQRIDWNSIKSLPHQARLGYRKTPRPAENSVQLRSLRSQTLQRQVKIEAHQALHMQITLSAGQQDALPSTDKWALWINKKTTDKP